MAAAGLQMMAPYVKNFALKSDGPKIATFAPIDMPTHKRYEHWPVTGAIVATVVDCERPAEPQSEAKRKRPSTASTPKAPVTKRGRNSNTPKPPATPKDGSKEDEEEDEEEEEEEEPDDGEEAEGSADLAADLDAFMDGDDPKAKPKAKPKGKRKNKPKDQNE